MWGCRIPTVVTWETRRISSCYSVVQTLWVNQLALPCIHIFLSWRTFLNPALPCFVLWDSCNAIKRNRKGENKTRYSIYIYIYIYAIWNRPTPTPQIPTSLSWSKISEITRFPVYFYTVIFTNFHPLHNAWALIELLKWMIKHGINWTSSKQCPYS